jgi:hypothetical protein
MVRWSWQNAAPTAKQMVIRVKDLNLDEYNKNGADLFGIF